MGDYLDTYTTEYPDSGGAVDSGYSVGSVGASPVRGGLPYNVGNVLSFHIGPRMSLWLKTPLSSTPVTFVKNGSTWTRVETIPNSYDRLVGGGYENEVSSTELDELEAAGLITTAEKNDILAGLT